jgi:outer membrane protein assembly factor BamD (BamD/ComL family)
MELERNDQAAAVAFLLKTVHASPPNSHLKNQAFMLLGDLSFDHKKYQVAKSYYDSVSLADLASLDNGNVFLDRKKALDRIVGEMVIIQRQDSLQRLARMSESDRTAYIKKMLKALHRQQGIDEEEQQQAGSFSFNNPTAASDLFGTGAENAEWYFNNNSMKAKGFTDFKTKWGNRYNIDDWAVGSLASRQRQVNNRGEALAGIATEGNAKQNAIPAASFESILANIPTTPEKMKKSMDSVERALFGLGKAYQDGLPDYLAAIGSYDSLLERFPNTRYREETLFDLYYCYRKLGLDSNAAGLLVLLKQQYPAGKFTLIITNPEAVLNTPENIARTEATRLYEQTYNSFIEGHFEQALEGKKKQDSLYGEKYWTPQLLYIEAVYYVHTRYDSIAISKLNAIIKKYPGSAIGDKAKNMLDVLTERKRLEEYLSNLKIERAKDDSFAVVQGHRLKGHEEAMGADSTRRKNLADSSHAVIKLNKVDSTVQAAKNLPTFHSVFRFEPEKAQLVVILLSKVDPVYVTETRNAFTRYNQENYYSRSMDIVNVALDDTNKLVVISGFDSAGAALDYFDKAQKLAPRLIIPWMPVGKYSLFIITSDNLDLLKSNKDLAGYRKFLAYYFPGKF